MYKLTVLPQSRLQVTTQLSSLSAVFLSTLPLVLLRTYVQNAKMPCKSTSNSLQVVPTYQSEIAPSSLRGFFVGSIQLCLTFGSLIAGIVNESMSKRTNDSGWQIATALQALPAVMIIGLLWFTPNSPRWLVFNDRSDEAVKVLRLVRPKEDVDVGRPELEIAAMREEGQIGKREKGGWAELFNAKNRRRTG